MVIVPGENKKLDKVTEFADAVGVLDDGVEGFEEYPEQPKNNIVHTIKMTISAVIFFMLLPPYQRNY